jgi:type I restriction enzyme M protein
VRISDAQKRLAASTSGRRKIGKIDYQAQGVLYITEKARFTTLLSLPEGTDIGKAINDGMKAIESENEDLKDVLPKACNTLDKTLLISLLKNFSSIPITIEGDAFGEIYEYFLGKFAMAAGHQKPTRYRAYSVCATTTGVFSPPTRLGHP